MYYPIKEYAQIYNIEIPFGRGQELFLLFLKD